MQTQKKCGRPGQIKFWGRKVARGKCGLCKGRGVAGEGGPSGADNVSGSKKRHSAQHRCSSRERRGTSRVDVALGRDREGQSQIRPLGRKVEHRADAAFGCVGAGECSFRTERGQMCLLGENGGAQGMVLPQGVKGVIGDRCILRDGEALRLRKIEVTQQ